MSEPMMIHQDYVNRIDAIKHHHYKGELTRFTYAELLELRAMVENEMEAKRETEILETRERMEEIAQRSGFTLAEIMSAPTPTRQKGAGAPKYQNPDDPEQTWTGRGKRPGWLSELLLKGRAIEEFEIAA